MVSITFKIDMGAPSSRSLTPGMHMHENHSEPQQIPQPRIYTSTQLKESSIIYGHSRFFASTETG